MAVEGRGCLLSQGGEHGEDLHRVHVTRGEGTRGTQGKGWGLRQVGKGTLHWPWGSGGEVQKQGQEVGLGMAEGWGKRRE